MANVLFRPVRYIYLTAAVVMLCAACSGTAEIGEAPSDEVCSAIVNVKCVKCHYKTRICDAVGTKSARYWKKTVNFMLKQGADLTGDEENKVIACLSSLPKGSKVVCD